MSTRRQVKQRHQSSSLSRDVDGHAVQTYKAETFEFEGTMSIVVARWSTQRELDAVKFVVSLLAVSYTHLTLPTNREV